MHPTAARLAERLHERGLHIEVRTLSDSARTAALAAAALGVEVGQIVKSLVFRHHDEIVLVLCAGDRRVDAERLGLSPILMAAANSSGGVMGKMIDAQSIVVASTATRWFGHEWRILRYVFFHSLALATLVGVLVLLQQYVFTWMLVKG